MSKYKCILFDWDGCLAKTIDPILQAYKQTFSEYNLHPSDELIFKEVFGDWNGPIKVGVKNLDEFNEKFKKRMEKNTVRAELYPNVLSTLKSLKLSGKSMAVVTSSPRAQVVLSINNNRIGSYFTAIVAAEDVAEHKPSPEALFVAMKMLGGNIHNTIIIGDSKSDLGAANNAGIDSVLFAPPDHQHISNIEEITRIYAPSHVISDQADLLKIIL